MSDSVRPHRRQPTRLRRPWDSPGKNTGVGCHFLLQCMKVKSENEVTELCLTLSDLMNCSPPGSSANGIFQARVLEWGAIAFSECEPWNHETQSWYMMRAHLCPLSLWFGLKKGFQVVLLLSEWVKVTQSFPILCDPIDYSPPGSSVHGILQARILQWVAICFSRGSSWHRDWTQVSYIAGRLFIFWASREVVLFLFLFF